jgi:AcrR family transcriptional regulator
MSPEPPRPKTTRAPVETPPDAAPRRADARRSVAAILDAATRCLRDDPHVTMTAIAQAAGVGRVTLYAHFPSREALVTEVVARSIAEIDPTLEAAVADDRPADLVFRDLIRSAWQGVDQAGRFLGAVQHTLDPQQLRDQHAPALARIEQLVARGRREGVFRTDLPLPWLMTTTYALFHAAAEDIEAGRLRVEDAAKVLEATLLPALAPPRPDRPHTAG